MFEIKLFTIDHFVLWVLQLAMMLWLVCCLPADVTFNHGCFFSNLSSYFEHFTSVTGEENSFSVSWSKICPRQHNNNKTRRLQALHRKTKHPIRMYSTATNSCWVTTLVWSIGYPWRHRYTLSVFPWNTLLVYSLYLCKTHTTFQLLHYPSTSL